MTSTCEIGDRPVLFVDFTNDAAVAFDPTSVQLEITEPDGVKTTVGSGFANPTVGRYEHSTFTVTKAGRHFTRWLGAGAVIAAQTGELYSKRSRTP